MADLTPEQKAKANKLASGYYRYALYAAIVAWLLFMAAVWFGSWKLAGLGVLVLIPALFLTGVATAMHSPKTQKLAAERINRNQL